MNCKHCKAQWTSPADVSISKCPFCAKPLVDPTEVGNDARPDAILKQVVERFDVAILGDRRLSSILSDFMPHVERRYKRIFAQALQDGIGAKLLDLKNEDEAIRTATTHALKSSFRQNNALDHTADYVVDCFLFSLGWIEEAIEKDSFIDDSAANIIKSQLEAAMADGCLSTDETALLFSLGSKLNLSEAAISQIINDDIKQKGFKPSKTVDKNIKSPKDILCFCDWATDTYLTKHSKQKAANQPTQPTDFAKVEIGNQIWMKENLNVDKFHNGDPIPHIKSDKEWEKAGEEGKPAWCYYDNDSKNGAKYGKLYNWHAVIDHRKLAPIGWEIPGNNEWEYLIRSLGICLKNKAGLMLKSSYGWNDNGNGTDKCNFHALPGGSRTIYSEFCNKGINANFWTTDVNSSVNAWSRKLGCNFDDIKLGIAKKGTGFFKSLCYELKTRKLPALQKTPQYY